MKGEDWQDLAHWQDHEIGEPLGPRGEEQIRLQILGRVRDTIIYDIIAGLLK